MRLVYFSDVHLHNWPHCSKVLSNGMNSRLRDGLNVVRQILDKAVKSGASYAVLGGDLFHNRRELPVEAVHSAYRLFDRYAKKLQIIAYAGNHDLATSGYGCSLSFLRGAGVWVITEPCLIHLDGVPVGIVPYQSDPARFYKLTVLLARKGARLTCIHQSLDGVIVPTGFFLEATRVSPKKLPKGPVYLCGHIHLPGEYNGRVFYSGSPMHLDWGDTRTEKRGFLEVSVDEEIEVKFRSTVFPQFTTLEVGVDHDDDINTAAKVRGNFVRVLYDTPEDAKEAKKILEYAKSCGPAWLGGIQMREAPAPDEPGEQRHDPIDVDRLIRRYVVKNVPASDPKRRARLYRLGRELLHEAALGRGK